MGIFPESETDTDPFSTTNHPAGEIRHELMRNKIDEWAYVCIGETDVLYIMAYCRMGLIYQTFSKLV